MERLAHSVLSHAQLARDFDFATSASGSSGERLSAAGSKNRILPACTILVFQPREDLVQQLSSPNAARKFDLAVVCIRRFRNRRARLACN